MRRYEQEWIAFLHSALLILPQPWYICKVISHALSFFLLLVFTFETAVPFSRLAVGFGEQIAMQAGDLMAGETEETCEKEPKLKDKEARTSGWSNCGIDFNPPAVDVEQAALIGFFISDYHRSAIDEPPES